MAVESRGPGYEEMADCLAKGQPLKTLFDVSDDQWESFYHRAFLMYKYGRNAEAEPMFRLLCLTNPREEKYWIALGVTQQQQNKPAEALASFLEGMRYGSCNPWAALHAAECYVQLKRDDLAFKSLTKASDWLLDSPDAKRILRRINLVLQSIRKRRKSRSDDENPTLSMSDESTKRDVSEELHVAAVERAKLRI